MMNYILTQHEGPANCAGDPKFLDGASLERAGETEADKDDPQLIHHLARIAEHGNRVLRVVFNNQVSPVLVVTVYFDRKLKGNL
jgi:hypothetical protein